MDVWGVDFDLLNDVSQLEHHARQAAKACGATILSVQSQQFEPQGATILVMLSESHFSIHTYPEKGFVALDCYTCGYAVDPMIAIEYMLRVFKPIEAFPKVLRRGVGPIEVIQSVGVGLKQKVSV
jgi:S-adenosylmethionine decarboxylase